MQLWDNCISQVVVSRKESVPHSTNNSTFAFTNGSDLRCFHGAGIPHHRLCICMTVVYLKKKKNALSTLVDILIIIKPHDLTLQYKISDA